MNSTTIYSNNRYTRLPPMAWSAENGDGPNGNRTAENRKRYGFTHYGYTELYALQFTIRLRLIVCRAHVRERVGPGTEQGEAVI